MPELSVVIVAGLHADARKATVAQLLADVPDSVVLHHDLATATAGTVVRTIRDATGIVTAAETPLVNDCACCALREDLVPELLRIRDTGGTRMAIVELWESVEPKAMAEVVTAGGLTVTGVITAVDPALVLPYLGNGDDLSERGLAAAATDQRTVADTFARQLEYAPVLAVTDSPEADEEDRELLAQLHPTARQVTISAPPTDALTVPPPRRRPTSALAQAALAGFDVESADAAQHPACALLPAEADAHGVSTLVWHRRRPFHPERLYAALEDLTCAAARSRGRFWLADKPDVLLHWDAAGGALCLESAGPWLASLPDAAWDMVPPVRRAAAALDWHPEHGDCCQHLVFTSPALDRDGLEQLLESCLLTDAEYAAGRAAWKQLPPAFDTLLEV
ncbi:cobalamin biosynthesis protein CobW [Streptomyces viridochromogenes]|uniref:Cobalamin biosynthesis protein CobW n=1 Tax=Streptomyces viridochromogenes TaxID=1938 RepID=A0A0J8BMD7_STRVR|nr:GTP-binding protein [Streptomyces viridochromogenes]KMS66750.1 cobalamin biosynthesis protein CobW [Streptomyces viridochromogenes]KOG10522.1 cobalamin biosynthesis protein CobW [Streptomyces viridochromogenes]KOG18626.1 cobalamin biosynthesis protein CobW [Streptomyces viridochromogenes]